MSSIEVTALHAWCKPERLDGRPFPNSTRPARRRALRRGGPRLQRVEQLDDFRPQAPDDGPQSVSGVIITSNLFLGRYAPDLPCLEEGARYREALFGSEWLTSFVNGKALTARA